MAEHYRADHVGSLLRPPAVLEARAAHTAGRISLDQLRDIEDKAIFEALEMQRQTGIDVFTDGEYRRSWWSGAIAESVEGVIDDPDAVFTPGWQGPHGAQADATAAEIGFGAQVVGAKLRQIRRLTAHESGFLKQHAPGPFKVTIPGALSRALGWYKPGLTDKFYPTLADLVQDIVDILQREVQALIAEGVPYIQLDSLRYVIQLADARTREQMLQAGQDLDKALDETIAADNATLQDARGAGVTVGLHMCRGNNRSAWRTAGGYEVIAEKAFNLLEVDRFLLEYDTERAGGFEPLRFVPPGKMVVLGLISSKDPQLESQDQLRRRIDEAAKYVPLERLALSPQCGFASTAPGNQLTWDEQRRKLELVAETARKVWGAAHVVGCSCVLTHAGARLVEVLRTAHWRKVMERNTNRILTMHAGSLARPPDLREMVLAKSNGQPYDAAALARRLRSAVAEVVQQQIAVGLDSINDGEFSKTNFTNYARERLSGHAERSGTRNPLARIYGRDAQEFPEYFAGRGNLGGTEVVCTGPLTFRGQAAIQTDIDNFKAALQGVEGPEPFLPAVAPGTIEHWMQNEYYRSDEEFLNAIADAMHEEYKAITDAGFLLQIDDPDLADAWQIQGDMSVLEYRKFAELRIEALNYALRDIPEESVRFNMCWGSYHGPHKYDIPLRDIVDLVLKVKAVGYSIEASNPRHAHEWRVWEDVKLPEGKVLIPGVVGHATDFIEHPELVAERLVKYANLVGRERVIAGTDCGLGTRVGHPKIAWAKFEALVEGAQLATQQLWG